MRKPNPSDGFAKCFLAMLTLHWWMPALSVVLFVLHFAVKIPLFLSWLVAVLWALVSLVRAGLVAWGNAASQVRDPVRKNRNPYSVGEDTPYPPAMEPDEEPAIEPDEETTEKKKIPVVYLSEEVPSAEAEEEQPETAAEEAPEEKPVTLELE